MLKVIVVCGIVYNIVLPGAAAEVALARAEELRGQVELLEVEHEGEKLRATMSFGVACFPLHGSGEDELVKHADQALYEAKRGGRNQVRLFGA